MRIPAEPVNPNEYQQRYRAGVVPNPVHDPMGDLQGVEGPYPPNTDIQDFIRMLLERQSGR
jgi:hypothetical protein